MPELICKRKIYCSLQCHAKRNLQRFFLSFNLNSLLLANPPALKLCPS